MVLIHESLSHAFGHAAQHAQYAFPAALVFGVQGVEASCYFVLCILAHGAGVQEHGIGLVGIVAGLVAGHLHHGGYHFAVGHGHLAAVSLNIQFLHLGCKVTKKRVQNEMNLFISYAEC